MLASVSETASVTTSATATACLQNRPSNPTGQEHSEYCAPPSTQSFTVYDDVPRTFAVTLPSVPTRLPTRPLAA